MIRKILFLLVFCLPSLAFGQRFNSVTDSSLYPSLSPGNYIPTDSKYAILQWRVQPRNVGDPAISDVRILPKFDYISGVNRGLYGWIVNSGEIGDPESYSYIYSIIDSENIYPISSPVPNVRLNKIQSALTAQGLGTVEQRAAYIASFKLSNVSIIDTSKIVESIVAMLGPWANIGIGIAIALFGIDLGTRKSKKIAGQAAKEARAAERREINRQIRNDGKAKGYRLTLSILAQAKRGDIDVGMSRRQARRKFEEVAADYAAYKRKRGWTS